MTIEMPRPFLEGSKLSMSLDHIIGGYSGVRTRPLRDGERRLGGWVLPPFQRPPVWTQAQQIKLIESLWLRLPIGAFVWNMNKSHEDQCDGWLLDGQQRLTAMLAYQAGEFAVFGARYAELGAYDRRSWEYGMPQACIETRLDDPEQCRDIYERLAYGGTPHERVT